MEARAAARHARRLRRLTTAEQLGTRPDRLARGGDPDAVHYVGTYLDGVRGWAHAHGGAGPARDSAQGSCRGRRLATSFQNVLVALTDPPQVYVKRHLVPFGEYFPVPPFVRSWMRLMNLPYTDAVPGAADQPALDVVGERIARHHLLRGRLRREQLHYLPSATLLVNVSNDAWFGDSIAPHQHLQIAQVRAAEAGRYLLRATNTGVTAVDRPARPRARDVAAVRACRAALSVRGFTGATPYAVLGQLADRARRLLVVLAQAGEHEIHDAATHVDRTRDGLPGEVATDVLVGARDAR